MRYVTCAVHLPVKIRISPKICLQNWRPSVGAATSSTVSGADILQLLGLLRYHSNENSFQKRYVLLLLRRYIKNGTHLKSGLKILILFFTLSIFPAVSFDDSRWSRSQIKWNIKRYENSCVCMYGLLKLAVYNCSGCHGKCRISHFVLILAYLYVSECIFW